MKLSSNRFTKIKSTKEALVFINNLKPLGAEIGIVEKQEDFYLVKILTKNGESFIMVIISNKKAAANYINNLKKRWQTIPYVSRNKHMVWGEIFLESDLIFGISKIVKIEESYVVYISFEAEKEGFVPILTNLYNKENRTGSNLNQKSIESIF